MLCNMKTISKIFAWCFFIIISSISAQAFTTVSIQTLTFDGREGDGQVVVTKPIIQTQPPPTPPQQPITGNTTIAFDECQEYFVDTGFGDSPYNLNDYSINEHFWKLTGGNDTSTANVSDDFSIEPKEWNKMTDIFEAKVCSKTLKTNISFNITFQLYWKPKNSSSTKSVISRWEAKTKTVSNTINEVSTLKNTEHTISWAYYQDNLTGQWFLSNSHGVTYILSNASRNSGELVWGEVAQGANVATIDFNRKTVTLSDLIDDQTNANSYLGIPLNGTNRSIRVNSPRAYNAARSVAGRTLDLMWYFFNVESTNTWYIINIPNADSTIMRLKLNLYKNDYDWQLPKDSSNNEIDTISWDKSFFQDRKNNQWKVKVNQ